jgi:glycerate-2-kinase
MIIQNKRELATTELRRRVLDIVEAGISRVLPANIITSAVKYDPARRILTLNKDRYDLSRGRIFVIGGGKASALMAQTLESVLSPENITDGVVNCKSKHGQTSKIKMLEAGHPVPDENGLKGVAQMLALKNRYSIDENDLVICLISGGGSALMPCPVPGVSLKDKQEITELLLGCGANIHEINAVRKHLSRTKGGGLGKYFSPAKVVSLILSDVIGNDLDVIASGPTCPDASTFSSAYKVLQKYGLLSRAPEAAVNFITTGCQGKVKETPKSLANCHNYLLGDNSLALEAMSRTAAGMGLSPFIVTAEQEGETTAVARLRAGEILSKKYASYKILLIGGETTPQLPENAGRGGRNQHYAAASMLALAEYQGKWALASVGTDGSDFLPDVAGAIVDHDSLPQAQARNIDVPSYLARYDSHTLMKKIGHSLIVTGSTGTNVGDIIVYALGEAAA